MPTYAYACTECSHTFDIHQPFSADSLTTCPECSGPLRKVFGAVGVSFNGSGFYRTDSRAAAKSSVPASSSSSSSTASSSSSTGSASGANSSSSSKKEAKASATPAAS